ncbi:sulfatase-like hydrolase/transferase [Bengtsoniella intestinalis]|uniref:sulfatase-like hydrolase/transferase n=1 Tax=Bengtsoniella intestinalis TaxID=3073143 RepID=UPI00391FA116
MVSESLEMTSHGYDGYVFDKDGNRVDFIGYRTDCITDYAINYLQNKSSDKPFLLFVSHIEPHQQNDRNCYEGPDGSKERFKDYKIPQDLLDGKFEGDWKANYADYLGQCRALDDNLGKLVNTLKDYHLYDDTVILYSSDHGCHFRTQDGEYKRNGLDSSLHIPMVAVGGPFRGGLRCDSMVSNIQIAPTVLSLAGVDMPADKDMTKETLMDAIEPTYPIQDVFFQISETECSRGIRTHKWKYCVSAPHVQPTLDMDVNFTQEKYRAMLAMSKLNSDSYIEQYLFDLEKDPYEKNNLVGDLTLLTLRSELKERLLNRMEAAGEARPEIYPHGTQLPQRY